VGGAVSRLKRLLVRGTSQPVFGLSAQATAFNGALLAYLAALAREVGALERQLRAERTAAEDARADAAALRAELAEALAALQGLRGDVATLTDAALPARVARLERGAGPVRLRLEATEDDPGREARAARHAASFGDGPVLHAGAGSGWALAAIGARASGVEADPELAAAAAAEGRDVRHGDPLAILAGLPEASLGGVLVTDLVERLDGSGLTALAGAVARALAPDGAVVVEGRHPAGVAADPDFWRDPDRIRPLHPDAVRMALEGAGLGTTRVETEPEDGAPRRYAVHARR
jgi:hypothetical protein